MGGERLLGSQALRKGVPSKGDRQMLEAASVTGHKDTKMLMRYTHLRVEDLVRRLG